MDLLPGVRAGDVDTDRLRLHYIESGPKDGVPVVMIHGNLSSAPFLLDQLPETGQVATPETSQDRSPNPLADRSTEPPGECEPLLPAEIRAVSREL